jgi:hypothetical protein
MIETTKSISFIIEDLKRPEKPVPVFSYSEILKRLIETRYTQDIIYDEYSVELINSPDYDYGIIAHNQIEDKIVNWNYHSFFYGLYNAYAEHRPFILSPDIIWLLIIQGFSHHINFNSKKLRNKFVDFDEKLTLVIVNERLSLKNENSPWHEIFPEFTQKINELFGNNLVDTITSNFSTTTENELIASQITLMHSVKSFVEYLAFGAICGIPEITLEGTTEDWENILNKAEKLRTYELGWWIDELKPVLQEFIETSKGNINKTFWKKIFKQKWEGCGFDEIFDGWFVKFFPYDKDGKKLNLKTIDNRHNLPNEIVKVPFKYIEEGKTYELEVWSGFFGLQQNNDSFSLKPQIGWMVRQNMDIPEEKEKLGSHLETDFGYIAIRVKTIPAELFELNEISNLIVFFIGNIIIPKELSKVTIGELVLYGKISSKELFKLFKLFPKSRIMINDVSFPINSINRFPVLALFKILKGKVNEKLRSLSRQKKYKE